MSWKSCPFLYSESLIKNGHDFVDIQYRYNLQEFDRKNIHISVIKHTKDYSWAVSTEIRQIGIE